MSSQLYNYISDLIVNYFRLNPVPLGERFNYYLEDINSIELLYEALKERHATDCEDFTYKHPDGGKSYSTFAIKIGDTKIIIASAASASEDYFTMLRNKVSEQKEDFEGTAILILFSGKLDSLLGGSGSLSKEGMPLHYSIFRDRIKSDISAHETLVDLDKQILNFILDKKVKSVVEDNNSIFDFKEVINTIKKGEIEKEDFKELGLFPHEELKSKNGDITNDLSSNYDSFQEFEKIFSNGDPAKDLDGQFSVEQITRFIKDGWEETDFALFQRQKEKEKEKCPPVFKEAESDNLSNPLWVKNDGKTVTKKRNINIIAFNPSLSSEFSIFVKFDKNIKNSNLRCKSRNGISVSSSGHRIIIEVKDYDYSDLFYIIKYKDSETNAVYNIKLLMLPLEPVFLRKFESNYLIKYSKSEPQLYLDYYSPLIFNPTADEVLEADLVVNTEYICNENQQLKLTLNSSSSQDETLQFILTQNGVSIPIAVNFEAISLSPISGIEVWRDKRVSGKSFRFQQEINTIKLIFENEERTVRDEYRNNLIQEKQIIDSLSFSWTLTEDNNLTTKDLKIDQKMRDSFNKLRNHYKSTNSLPSLTYQDKELRELSFEYVHAYIEQLDSFKAKVPLKDEQKDLLWLGVVKEQKGEEKIKFSPLHPLNVAYQLTFNEKAGNQDIYKAILEKMSPLNLVPNLEITGGQSYIPIDSSHSPEWLYYSLYLNSKQATPKTFVSDLVRDKITDFTTNFDFLFTLSNTIPLKINVVNLGDCKEIVQGIFKYYRKHLNHNKESRPQELLPIEICIYGSDQLVTKFEELAFYDNAESVEKILNIDLSTTSFAKDDLLNAFWDKVTFYSRVISKKIDRYEYAHISFYQFDIAKTGISYDDMKLIKTGVSLHGLLADVSSTPTTESYRTGFGTLDLSEEPSELIQLASLMNSFARVYANNHPYEKDKVLSTTINFSVRDQLNLLYQDSQWVTYIDPKVDLDFFKENKDLVIIHYNDQYSNSSGYDAITVSRKTSEYEFIVKEFLLKHKVKFDPTIDCIQIINLFNAINGAWLLKLIKQNSQFPREKLSLLSGVKTALTYLHHPDVIWVPISLEEILRISGNVGLNTESGLLSAKNLGVKGSLSDDLLFIGLEMFNGQLLMHFYPIELKIGRSNLVSKGIEQGRKTATVIREHLRQESFLAEFYKNFFAKILLANVKKLKIFHIWDSQNWDLILNDYRQRLLNNDFIISNRFDDSIGKFGVFHFGTDNLTRRIKINDEYLKFDLLEEDGYNFLVKPIDDLIKLIHNSETSIDRERLFANLFNVANTDVYTEDPLEEEFLEKGITRTDQSYEINLAYENSADEIEKEVVQSEIKSKVEFHKNAEEGEGIKILFGTDLNSQKEVIWEPNNTSKVMHTNTGIIGTMGTGKTQFTKSLITQFYNNLDKNIGKEKLGILIFDYKGDYIKEDFVTKTNAKVYHPYHLPYNPLALDATSKSKPMLPLHTANDIKETIANAFNLGNVQKQKLRDLIVEAYENKGISKSDKDTWSLTPPTIGDVCDLFLSQENNAQDSLYAAISNLSEFKIFEPNATKTQSLYSLIEGVVVINLSGYDESIQNLIVAITLDAFYTQMQRNGHSEIQHHLRQIRKMILVDEADNFLSKNFNSIRKILKEGREFGVGTILSTQFLSHFATSENEYSNYILTWVIHRVNEIKMKEVDSLFSLDSKLTKDNLIKTIKDLDIHQSIVNLAGSAPILIKDKAFWEL